jgi:hypothetical protein
VGESQEIHQSEGRSLGSIDSKRLPMAIVLDEVVKLSSYSGHKLYLDRSMKAIEIDNHLKLLAAPYSSSFS